MNKNLSTQVVLSKESAIAIREYNGEVAMSSLRIAEITGKTHRNVLRDVDKVISQLSSEAHKIKRLKFESFEYNYKNGIGVTLSNRFYILPEREFNLVISGYSIKYRVQLIDELMDYRANESKEVKELEDILTQVAPKGLFGEVSKATNEPKTKLVRAYYKGDKSNECNKIAKDIHSLKQMVENHKSDLFGNNPKYIESLNETIESLQSKLDVMLVQNKDELTRTLEARESKLLKS